MSENVIELIKDFAYKTGNISKEALEEKSTKNALIEDGNELYRTILLG